MSGWWDQFPEANTWMYVHGLEPRAGAGVWIKDIGNRDGEGSLKI